MKRNELYRVFTQTIQRIMATTGAASVACQEASRQLGMVLAAIRVPESSDSDAPAELAATLNRLHASADVIDALTRDLRVVLDALTKDAPAIN